MECKKAQDKLMTEYLDKELDAEERAEVERHFAGCADCREFFEAVQRTAVIPFEGAEEMRPDHVVWQKIREKIETERSRSGNGLGKWANAWVSLLRMPQPVFHAAFVTTLILGVIVLAKWPPRYADPVYGYVFEQMTFLGELGAGNTDLMNGDLKDYDAVFKEISE